MNKVKKISKGKRRSAARMAAIQAFYDMELSCYHINKIMADFLSGGVSANLDDETVAADSQLFEDIMRGVNDKKDNIDIIITSSLSKGRSLARLEILVRAILRCGTYELIAKGDTDSKLIISEYIGLADSFYSGQEPAFVNGVLDKIARVVRDDEFASNDNKDNNIDNDDI